MIRRADRLPSVTLAGFLLFLTTVALALVLIGAAFSGTANAGGRPKMCPVVKPYSTVYVPCRVLGR